MDTTATLPMDILDFWFGELEGENAVPEKRQRWYQSSNAFDEAIKEKFLSTYQAALAEQLGDWKHEPSR